MSKSINYKWASQFLPKVPILRKLRKKYNVLEANLDYMARSYLKIHTLVIIDVLGYFDVLDSSPW